MTAYTDTTTYTPCPCCDALSIEGLRAGAYPSD